MQIGWFDGGDQACEQIVGLLQTPSSFGTTGVRIIP